MDGLYKNEIVRSINKITISNLLIKIAVGIEI